MSPGSRRNKVALCYIKCSFFVQRQRHYSVCHSAHKHHHKHNFDTLNRRNKSVNACYNQNNVQNCIHHSSENLNVQQEPCVDAENIHKSYLPYESFFPLRPSCLKPSPFSRFSSFSFVQFGFCHPSHLCPQKKPKQSEVGMDIPDT